MLCNRTVSEDFAQAEVTPLAKPGLKWFPTVESEPGPHQQPRHQKGADQESTPFSLFRPSESTATHRPPIASGGRHYCVYDGLWSCAAQYMAISKGLTVRIRLNLAAVHGAHLRLRWWTRRRPSIVRSGSQASIIEDASAKISL